MCYIEPPSGLDDLFLPPRKLRSAGKSYLTRGHTPSSGASHIQSCPEALKTMPLTTIQDISKGSQSSHEVGQSLCGAQYLLLLHPDSLPSSQVAIPGAPFCRLIEISLKVSSLGSHPSSFGITEGNREVCFKAKKKDIEQSNKKL